MAVYVSRAQRKRKAIILAVATALIGLVLGWVIGRSQVPTIGSRVTSVQESAGELASRIDALTIEYRQAIEGQGDTIQGGVLDAIDGIRSDTLHELDRAPWITQDDRDALTDAITALGAAAKNEVPVTQFEEQATSTSALLRTTFDLTPA
ncbi:MAG: hypothetical protein AB7N61_00190 [Acidimicrobiia bacterium]